MERKIDVCMAQGAYDLTVSENTAAAEALLDDASLLHVPGRSGLAGQYQGREAILGLVKRMAQLTDGTVHFSPSRVLTANDQAIVLCGRANATRQGTHLDTDEMHIFSLRDGKIREIWIFHENQDHVDEFWAAYS